MGVGGPRCREAVAVPAVSDSDEYMQTADQIIIRIGRRYAPLRSE
jgi:hypothetical protein